MVDAVLAETRRTQARIRALPARVVVYLLLAAAQAPLVRGLARFALVGLSAPVLGRTWQDRPATPRQPGQHDRQPAT
jgi:hypothetical protein